MIQTAEQPGISSPAAKQQTRADFCFTALAVAFIVLVYLWIVSAGTWTNWPSYDSEFGYHDAQANAFLHGQSHLLVEPDPKLLALPDPFDSHANRPYRLHDAVLFKGKYYLYWGPVPALILCVIKLCGAGAIHDKFLTFGFAVGTVVFQAASLLIIRRRFFPKAPLAIFVASLLAVGLCYPITYTLARAAVYEAAILGGQCFMSAAMLLLLIGWRGRSGSIRLAGASLLMAAAVGCRVSLVPAAGAVILITIAYMLSRRDRDKADSIWTKLLALTIPIMMCGVAFAAYNVVRFGSPTEFGAQWQLAGMNVPPYHHLFMSWRYVPVNLSNYFLTAARSTDGFPFAVAEIGKDPVPKGIHIPGMRPEPVVGLLMAAPACILAIFCLRLMFTGQARGAAVWLVMSWACVAVLGFLPGLTFASCTMRYLADLAPGFMLLAAIGAIAWVNGTLPATRARRFSTGLTLSLTGYTIILGLMLGSTGYKWTFHQHNPAMVKSIIATLQRIGLLSSGGTSNRTLRADNAAR